jgi:hypothetical protein
VVLRQKECFALWIPISCWRCLILDFAIALGKQLPPITKWQEQLTSKTAESHAKYQEILTLKTKPIELKNPKERHGNHEYRSDETTTTKNHGASGL